MSIAHIIVTVLAIALVAISAGVTYARAGFVVKQLTEYGVPRSWWPWLGTAKAAGALGLLAGLFLPGIGVAAGICLVLYFIGALITVLRARCYSHIQAPLVYLAPVVGSLVLGLAA
jgi:hypothetical protein